MKEKKAIEFIQKVSETFNEKPIYAGNSGGKDSAVLDYLLNKSGIEYKSVYANTTIDPIGTLKYIRETYPNTKIIQPKETFLQLVERKGLPTRLQRFCCDKLKEHVSVGKNIFEGIRRVESKGRKDRDYIQCDTRKSQKGSQHIYPIYDWTDSDVWNFIKEKKIVLAPHYSLGFNRLGCVGCPLVTRKGVREKEFLAYPQYYRNIKKAIQNGMDNNPQWKISIATNHNSDLAMQYWLSGKTIDEYFGTTRKVNGIWIKNKNINIQTTLFKGDF